MDREQAIEAQSLVVKKLRPAGYAPGDGMGTLGPEATEYVLAVGVLRHLQGIEI